MKCDQGAFLNTIYVCTEYNFYEINFTKFLIKILSSGVIEIVNNDDDQDSQHSSIPSVKSDDQILYPDVSLGKEQYQILFFLNQFHKNF